MRSKVLGKNYSNNLISCISNFNLFIIMPQTVIT